MVRGAADVTPMIDEKRIEAAAVALFNANIWHGYDAETKAREWQRDAGRYRSHARAALAVADAVVGEAHWLAPNQLGADILWECESIPYSHGTVRNSSKALQAIWAAIRTAYLSRQPVDET